MFLRKALTDLRNSIICAAKCTTIYAVKRSFYVMDSCARNLQLISDSYLVSLYLRWSRCKEKTLHGFWILWYICWVIGMSMYRRLNLIKYDCLIRKQLSGFFKIFRNACRWFAGWRAPKRGGRHSRPWDKRRLKTIWKTSCIITGNILMCKRRQLVLSTLACFEVTECLMWCAHKTAGLYPFQSIGNGSVVQHNISNWRCLFHLPYIVA